MPRPIALTHPAPPRPPATEPDHAPGRQARLELPGAQLTLGIEFAPIQMRERGLQEAHTHPRVSQGKLRPDGEYISWRTTAANAWGHPEVEQRTANSWPTLILDVDGRDAVTRIMDAIMAASIEAPNWLVQRRSSGGVHAFWTLARPVLRGPDAHPRPMRAFTRIAEWYQRAVRADPGFPGVLAHNAVYPGDAFATDWLSPDPFSLAQLASLIPKGWTRPPRIQLQSYAGRNDALFRRGMQFAGSIHHREMAVAPVLVALNREFEHPLPDSEVQGIARSVERYRLKPDWNYWQAGATGGKYTHDPESQRARGVRSGDSRRSANAERDDQIEDHYKAGNSIRSTGRTFGLAHSTVLRILRRRGVVREPNPVDLPISGGSGSQSGGPVGRGGAALNVQLAFAAPATDEPNAAAQATSTVLQEQNPR